MPVWLIIRETVITVFPVEGLTRRANNVHRSASFHVASKLPGARRVSEFGSAATGPNTQCSLPFGLARHSLWLP